MDSNEKNQVILEKILEEFQKLNLTIEKSILTLGNRLIDSMKKPYSWSDLPSEMKLEVIDKMGVLDRYLFRCTSKADRSLVDSQKIDIDKIEINVTSWKTLIWYSGDIDSDIHGFRRNDEIIIPETFMKFLLKITKVKEFHLDFGRMICLGEDHPPFPGPYKIQSCPVDDTIDFCLSNLSNGCKMITLDADNVWGFPEVETLLAHPSIQTAKLWQIKNRDGESDCVVPVVQMFREKHFDIGTTFQVMFKHGSNSMDNVIEEFDFYIVSKTENVVRIKTEDYSKHILLERCLGEGSDDGWEVEPPEYIRLQVIPRKLKESKYETDHTTWMKVLCPENFPDPYEDNYDDYYYPSEDSDEENGERAHSPWGAD
ncbi:hypothetical protein B9Z55_007728 [Caenorhabditis nigoni]|uniref:F-box domain-containing protein n=1 Tax=Caenorhabditis nigoni TaxID=1611254 RepID=A0A2G5VAY2_9PELO|nr:hypothetical protein B9Z55_007728 [Caenorhabditis nigoni]